MLICYYVTFSVVKEKEGEGESGVVSSFDPVAKRKTKV